MKLKKKIKVMSLLLAASTILATLQFSAITAGASNENTEITNLDAYTDIEENRIEQEIVNYSAETEIETNGETETWSYEYTEPLSIDEMTMIGDNTVGLTSTQITSSTIPDGVYALENVGNPGLWMDTQWQRSDPGYHIQQYAQSTCPADSFYRSSLFKITNIPGTNRYVIRSMLNNRLTFTFSGAEVLTKEIPPKDSDVSLLNTYTITYNTNGYEIKPYGATTFCVAANDTAASGSSGAPDSYLKKEKNSVAGNQGKWKLFQYTGGTQSGATIKSAPSFVNSSITVDTTSSLKLITWTTEIGANTPYLAVHPDYSNMVSNSWDSSTSAMTLTTQKVGTLRLRPIIRIDGTETAFRSYAYYYTIIPDINGKTVCVQNVGTDRYIDIQDASNLNGANIQQYDFTGNASLFWTMILESGGYFSIKSNHSDKYIGVDSTNTTLVRQYSSQSDYTKWKIIETSAGNYKFVCKATESTGKVLAPPSSSSGNGANLTLTSYTNDSDFKDEWNIPNRLVFLYGITNTNHNHLTCLENVRDSLDNNSENCVLLRSGAITTSICKSDWSTTNLFTSRSHGVLITYANSNTPSSTGLLLNDDSNNKVYILSHTYSNMNSSSDYLKNEEDYSNIDLALFIGCNTAYGGEGNRNIATRIVELGAKASIGFEESIGCSAANSWTTFFYTYFLQGKTVQESAELACNSINNPNSGLNSYVICGDETLTIFDINDFQ